MLPPSKRRQFDRLIDGWPAFLVIAFLGIVARAYYSPRASYPYDMLAFLNWTRYLATHSLGSFYAAHFFVPPDHLPGDMILFAGIGKLVHAIDPSFDFRGERAETVVRIVPMASDILLGALVWWNTRLRAPAGFGILAAALVILNPATIMVSTIWGQWDSFAALLLVAALILAMRQRTVVVWPLLTYLVLIKPQYIVFMLLIAGYLIRGARATNTGENSGTFGFNRLMRDTLIGWGASLVVFFSVCLPLNVGLPGQPGARFSIFDRVRFAVNRYDDITLGAQNVWSLFGKRIGDPDGQVFVLGLSYATAGHILLSAALVGAFAALFLIAPADWALLCASFVAAMSIYCFPTRVHERYMLPAIAILFLMWPAARFLLVPIVGLSATYCLSLMIAMWGTRSWDPGQLDRYLAIANLTLFVCATTTMLVTSFHESRESGRLRITRSASNPRSRTFRRFGPNPN